MSYRDELQAWRNRWAAAILEGRAAAGMSQPQLARHLGTAQSTVAMWEAGRSVPMDLMKVDLIAALGLDAGGLFGPLDARPVPERLRAA